MKKKIFTVLFGCTMFINAFAQAPIDKGQAQFNGGFGFSSWGLPVYLGFDYGVHKDVTVGGEVSFRSYRNKWGNVFYQHQIMGIAGNFNYHFNSLLSIPHPWNFYAGLNAGFFLWRSPDGYGGRASGLGIGGQVGGRYYFNDKIGINLELGGGNAVSGGKLGISIKL